MFEVPDVDFIRPVEFLVCFILLSHGHFVVSAILVVYSLCCVFMFDCVGELFVECVCYLCG